MINALATAITNARLAEEERRHGDDTCRCGGGPNRFRWWPGEPQTPQPSPWRWLSGDSA